MTLTDQHVPVLSWTEPVGIACRGTLVVIPGRGEQPAHYERFGRRVSANGYRVHAVADPAAEPALTLSQVSGQLAHPGTAGPRVLAGSGTGALFAAGLATAGQVPGLDALVLVGLPTDQAGPGPGSWDRELDARTACPAHRARLSAPGLRRGALYEPIPDGWAEWANLGALTQPVRGRQGGRAGQYHRRAARRAQRRHPPDGGRDDRVVPRAVAAGDGTTSHRDPREDRSRHRLGSKAGQMRGAASGRSGP
jgi:hypothetical protein